MAVEDMLVDDDARLDRVRFGRNRFLAAAAGTLFGAVAGLSRRADLAWGACGPSDPCVQYGLCCCCSASDCCRPGCRRRTDACWMPNGCWHTCNGVNWIKCCDWLDVNPCICREVLGPC